jgi:hypothetical protein
MPVKSKFEEGLDLLERAIPLLRQAYSEQEGSIRQGIIAAIAGGGQSGPSFINGGSAAPKDKSGKAPRGAADAAAMAILKGLGRHAAWSDFEKGAKAQGVSYSAVKKAVRRLKDDGKVKQEGFFFALK